MRAWASSRTPAGPSVRHVIAMPHALRSLVRTGPFHIEHCSGCNVLHVSIGALTIRLERGAALQLRAALGEALERIEGAVASSSPTPEPLHN